MSHRIMNQRVATLEQESRKHRQPITPEEADARVAESEAEARRTGRIEFRIDEDAPWTPEQAARILSFDIPGLVVIGIYPNGERRDFTQYLS